MRQKVGHLIHQIDTQLIVVNADVHMHATDDQPPRRTLHLMCERFVAILVRVFLFCPARERVR